MQVAVGAAVGQAMDQPRVSMETKDDVLVPGEEGVVLLFGQSVRMFSTGL